MRLIDPGHSGMVRKDQTSDAQLRIGESRDSGFDAPHRPGMTMYVRFARNDGRAKIMRRFVLPLLLALIGLILFGQGAYIHAKARLAQVLLERAFEKTIATGRETKPWSWADTWPVARIE